MSTFIVNFRGQVVGSSNQRIHCTRCEGLVYDIFVIIKDESAEVKEFGANAVSIAQGETRKT